MFINRAFKTMWKIICFFTIFEIITCSSQQVSPKVAAALKRKEQLLQSEYSRMTGNKIILNHKEQIVSKILTRFKWLQIELGFSNPYAYNMSRHFFGYRLGVKWTPVYHILRLMPKGALLHVHDMGLGRPEFLLKLTYNLNLYICWNGTLENPPKFKYSLLPPLLGCDPEWNRWRLTAEARYRSGNIRGFDANLTTFFTLVSDYPDDALSDVNKAWKKLEEVIDTITPLVTYKPNWDLYIYDALYYMYYDNIVYVEFRTELIELYDLTGRIYTPVETALAFRRVIDSIKRRFRDFYGGRLIYAPKKKRWLFDVKAEIIKASMLHKMTLITGFDLVGQEDLTPPLKNFVPDLVNAKDQHHLDYYFSAGETNWFGTQADENLVDAIVLEAKRIGNPYSIVKHPLLMDIVKEKGIALEMNVLSSQVMHLLSDFRNHPLSILLANDMPVVLGSDYNFIWGGDCLTHDFYVAFMATASAHSDLRLLKQLALNSMKYNTVIDKRPMMSMFQKNWNQFLDRVIRFYPLVKDFKIPSK